MSLLERQRAAQAALANQPAPTPDAPAAPADAREQAAPGKPTDAAKPAKPDSASSEAVAPAWLPTAIDAAPPADAALVPEPGSILPAIIPTKRAETATTATQRRDSAREELHQSIRIILQREVIGAFDSLLEGDPGSMNGNIEKIVDGVITANNFAVTRD